MNRNNGMTQSFHTKTLNLLKDSWHALDALLHSAGIWFLCVAIPEKLGWWWYDEGLRRTVHCKPEWAAPGDEWTWHFYAGFLPVVVIYAFVRCLDKSRPSEQT